MSVSSSMAAKLKSVPARPGVYLFKNRKGKILYIGKARRLDLRVRSHFRDFTDDARRAAMLEKVTDVEYIATQSEIEALILEANLVKQHRPRYNINLKDDKRFPFVKVTARERFPRIFLTRTVEEDGSRYFGPFTDVKDVRFGLRLLRGAFRLRSCPGAQPGRVRGRECLDYQIGICCAPCTARVTPEEYARQVQELLTCLSGRSQDVLESLGTEMEKASLEREYEKCTKLRDRVRAIESALRKQRVFALRDYDSDVLGLARHGDTAAAVVLKVREGKVLGKEVLVLEGSSGKSDAEVLYFALSQYYLNAAVIPREVLVPFSLEGDRDVVARWLSERAEGKVSVRTPMRGEGAGLKKMAEDNALLALEELRAPAGERPGKLAPEVQELQVALGLPSLPVNMEAFDISQISGSQAVASVVVFSNAKPRRSHYRRMRIKGVLGQDDFRMMREAVRRRAERLLKEEKPLPDYVLVDGGRAQVSAAVRALGDAGVTGLGVIGLAKGKEELSFSWRKGSVRLPVSSGAARLVQRMRNEAHRFAITYHRKLRKKETVRSALDEVEGVGVQKRRALLKHFGSVRALKEATVDQISAVRGVGPVLARRILRQLREGPRRETERRRSA
ncbi:MAG: excinuclease ABC subunit UvrC [Candidatus Eiseniibacteriota bacterium]|nr:MAG: excinuclease ABC subunit UvrC [Candidatus Eisenbacteria bacterium]